jgi:hydroxyethylthiazole kinase-like uncharacterized protein yjeF
VKPAFEVAAIRTAEAALMDQLDSGALMQRAAHGLAIELAAVLEGHCSAGVSGARIVALIGAGNNGGDALFACSELAKRGASVVALTMADRWHEVGAAALLAAGGRIDAACADSSQASYEEQHVLIRQADVVVDGILGIGGSGALVEPAAGLAARAAASAAIVVAVDVPSGVDADTGAVADPDAAVWADLTVTFGVLKLGLLVPAGSDHVGELNLVDIGLHSYFEPGDARAKLVETEDAGAFLPLPGRGDDKYTRGVVGVVAGSGDYPGAAVLCTGSARLGGAGMVRYAGGAPGQVISHWPEVVIAREGPAAAGQVQTWVVGPGGGTDQAAHQRLVEALAVDVPVVIDADGLTLLAQHEGLRSRVKERYGAGLTTILTPHAGEFARLGFELSTGGVADRIGAVQAAAADLGAVVLLKGHSTVVAAPTGEVFVNTLADSALATAGSGDVLSGLVGSLVAAQVARAGDQGGGAIAEVVACAALIHGLAGQLAAVALRPVTALDVLAAVSEAIADLRRRGSSDG